MLTSIANPGPAYSRRTGEMGEAGEVAVDEGGRKKKKTLRKSLGERARLNLRSRIVFLGFPSVPHAADVREAQNVVVGPGLKNIVTRILLAHACAQ